MHTTLRRVSEDGLYPAGAMWVGVDGWLYGGTGPRPVRKVAINLAALFWNV